MKYAFDLDGTISARPDVFGPMMRALRDGGHYVCVLTSSCGPPGNSPDWRLAQLASLGILPSVHFDEVLIALGETPDLVGDKKGLICRSEGIAFMVDDTEAWLQKIKASSPYTLCVGMA